MQLLLLLTKRLITWMGCFAFFTITYTSKLANFMWKKNNLAIFLVLICMVQFNNIFALCKMNKPAGLMFWQQRCTLQHGTHRLRSPRWDLGTVQRWWTHSSLRGGRWTWWRTVSPDRLFTGQAWGWLQRWLPCFFLQLGVPFCSKGIVSVANWWVSRLDEIKTFLLYVLNPGS